ncbi:MAG: hypothetical protein KFF72_05280 [Arthrospira sp. SH-MAG29]|nr:hypothetical protein [Arthrospira sp. SH-MAG29]MBS0015766.1 hypothetical protein [Arthrospira sp. SH-MAG29]
MKNLDPEDKFLLPPEYDDFNADFQLWNHQQQLRRKVSKTWYVILCVYALLLSFTGGVAFFYNNGFYAKEENIKKMEMMKTSEQFNTYQLLLKMEIDNMKNINQIANQSFNVALGSLLGFLSATLTKSHADNNE